MKSLLRKLNLLETKIKKANKRKLFSMNWRNDVHRLGGVYVIWIKKTQKATYVGETCNLYQRFGDLGRTVNHTFRRKVAAKFRINQRDDNKITDIIKRDYLISFIELEFGRKELEEYLIVKWYNKFDLINKPSKRLKSNDFYKKFNDQL